MKKYLAAVLVGVVAIVVMVAYQSLREGLRIEDVVPSETKGQKVLLNGELESMEATLKKELQVPPRDLSDDKLDELIVAVNTYIFEGNLIQQLHDTHLSVQERKHAKNIVRNYVILNEEKDVRNNARYRAEIEKDLHLIPQY